MLPESIAFFASAPCETNGSAALAVCAARTHVVLVVDDDKDIRDLLSDALRAEGYSVLSARHGAEALERLRACRPDLILLDLMMPVMDGLAFMAAKDSDPVIHDIPVIAMTAATRNHVEGAVTLMRKPFDLDVFLANVAHWVRKRSAE
jgi:two-component system, chemotaxis family, chemotaxis protein CheY